MGEKVRDVLALRRMSKEVKRYVLISRIMGLLAVILITIVAVAYAISYFYDKFGSFTVKINKYDMVKQGLSLSETPYYERTESRLHADFIYDLTNISGNDLPDNIDMINGSHNGDNYIAYTFYLSNSGDDTITYQGEIYIDDVSNNLDEAVRVAVYENGVRTIYGKTKSNGSGMESDCDSEFLASTLVMRTERENFEPRAKDKYTIVIWIEGNDPDCTDDLVGGSLKLGMDFVIVPST